MKKQLGSESGVRRWVILPRFAAIVLGVWGGAETAHAQSLQDALTLTYQTNPEILAQRSALEADAELIASALSGWFLPELTTSISEEHGRIDFRERLKGSTNTVSDLNEHYYDRTAELEMTMDLYNGGSSTAEIKYARANLDATKAILASTEQSVLGRAAKAYLGVVRARKLLALAQARVADIEQLQQKVSDTFSRQRATITDLEETNIELSSVRRAVTASQNVLDDALAEYKAVVGEAAMEFVEWPALPAVPNEFADALNVLSTQNPNILAVRSELEARQAQVESEFGDQLPTLSVYGLAEYEYDNIDFSGTSNYKEGEREITYAVGVQLTMSLYDGGATQADVRRNKRLVEQSRSKLQKTERDVILDLRDAWLQFESSSDQIELAHGEWLSAESLLEGRLREYDRRAVTVDKVIDARSSVHDAQSTIIEQTFTGMSAEVDVLLAAGTFGPGNLELDVPLYDPNAYARDVEGNSWIPYYVK